MAQNTASANAILKQFSTYTLLIPQSICSQLRIKISPKDLLVAMQDSHSIYQLICQAPLQNMINGVILAQIKTYQVFLQKRLIDCYVNAAPTATELENTGEEPAVSDNVTEIKDQFLKHVEDTKPIEQSHFNLVADTYGFLKKFVSAHQDAQGRFKAYGNDFKIKVDDFLAQGKILEAKLLEERINWREHAIEVSDAMMKMGTGRIDELEDLEQRAELAFFQRFGENL
jgi:hypothetical protein